MIYPLPAIVSVRASEADPKSLGLIRACVTAVEMVGQPSLRNAHVGLGLTEGKGLRGALADAVGHQILLDRKVSNPNIDISGGNLLFLSFASAGSGTWFPILNLVGLSV
jgi:hypothetical protein